MCTQKFKVLPTAKKKTCGSKCSRKYIIHLQKTYGSRSDVKEKNKIKRHTPEAKSLKKIYDANLENRSRFDKLRKLREGRVGFK